MIFATTSLAEPIDEENPLYIGTRALSMGNAFTAVADDATAGFWNPAGMVQWEGVKLFGMNKFHDRSDYAFDPKGIAYSYRKYSFFWGNKISIGTTAKDPDFNYYSFAHQFGPYISIGGTLKFQRKRYVDFYQFFGYKTSYSLSFLTKPTSKFRFGSAIDSSRQIRSGISYRWKNSLVAVDLAIPEFSLHGGIESEIISPFSLRIGNSNGDWTLGVGVTLKHFSIGYAVIREEHFNSHFVSSELSLP